MSTLCAGCGHDSITAALVRALWELSTPPHMLVKMSGIGCSSKTPAYFVNGAHGFNSAHGRMPPSPPAPTPQTASLTYIGVSGDGDSLSIGSVTCVTRSAATSRWLYIIENNGVYGLTKGQFSASADVGSKSKRGEANQMSPIDPVHARTEPRRHFLARSFSGDKEQLVPILKAALAHRGFALVDVISPCVTFNDHVGSTKSYLYTRKHACAQPKPTSYLPPPRSSPRSRASRSTAVTMHDGSVVRFRSVPKNYDPTDRAAGVMSTGAPGTRGGRHRAPISE